jgi:uncharacterized protein (TIGR00369 family)
MGGKVVAIDQAQQTLTMSYVMTLDFCHSGNVVQGGFVTGMLDSAMAHAVFGSLGFICPLPSLEIKVSFLAPSFAGNFTAQGRVIRAGKSIVFLEGTLYDENGDINAIATSTAKIIRPRT